MTTKSTHEPIAIIGSACHFAGDVSSVPKLWDFLQYPREVQQDIPDSRFVTRGFYHERHTHPGHSNVQQGYLMRDDLSLFDAEFFGLSPAEAKAIDPQQRWLIETVYEGLEAAGLPVQAMRGSDTAVYVGVMGGDYEQMQLRDLQDLPTYFATGTARSIISNRISHFFDWRGPSVTIDTACSSSLVALHMAVHALRAGDSRVAVACGSNLILGPESFIAESNLKMLSPDGVGRMWDQDANGYARGDGVAVVIVKKLSEALRDGDHVECVIRETGINQDGATSGITTPSASAQEALIRSTYLKASLDISKPQDRPQYFEAHGTGTPAGDPAEAEAIHRAFFGDEVAHAVRPQAALDSERESSILFVGSVKTVLGHTESTAGLAGVLKASLALQNGIMPPNLHFNRPSDRVAPFCGKLEIVRGAAKPWPRGAVGKKTLTRRASVNSFGFGGTNAHAILESYSDADGSPPDLNGPLFTPFVFSAGSEISLRAIIRCYANFLGEKLSFSSHDLAWTLRQRRSLLSRRISFAASSIEDLQAQLLAALEDETKPIGVQDQSIGTAGAILGIFTGQGAQYARLGAELIEQSSTARAIIVALDAHLADLPDEHRPSWSLVTEMLARGPATRVMEAAIAQPVCTAVQIMLVDLLASAGVHFDMVVGHSSGEIGAAYAAGVLTAHDAILVAYFRGRCVSQWASRKRPSVRGAMLAVSTSMEDAEVLCRDDVYAGRLAVAAYNSSLSVTISGDEDAIDEIQELLQDEKKFYRRLCVDVAYHSQHMDPCFAPYVECLKGFGVRALKPWEEKEQAARSTRCQWFSSVHNCPMDLGHDMGLSDRYWAENLTRPVQFAQALKTAVLSTAGMKDLSVVLEVGPHPALQRPTEQTIHEALGKSIPYHSTLFRDQSSVTALSSSLGFLWQHLQRLDGVAVPNLDLYERVMNSDQHRHRQEQNHRFKVVKGLPSHQWNHTTRHWAESRISRRMRLRNDIYHPLLGHATPDSSKHHLRWRNLLRTGQLGDSEDVLQLNGHQVQGQPVFPAAGYVVTAVEAARALPNAVEDAAAAAATQETKMKVLLIVIHNMTIHQAVILAAERRDGVEILVELTDILRIPTSNRIKARFSYSAAIGHHDELTLVASSEIEVVVGEDLNPRLLPPRLPLESHMIPVEKDRFYTSLAALGYEYDGAFRSLTNLNRKHGKASCTVIRQGIRHFGERHLLHNGSGDDQGMLMHPADLDSALQSLLLAFSYPGDDQLRTLHLPLRIERVRVNPALCRPLGQKSIQVQSQNNVRTDDVLLVDSYVNCTTDNGQTMPSLSSPHGGYRGDVNIFTSTSTHAAVQVHNVQLVPLGGPPTEQDDRDVFSEERWVDLAPDGLAAALADRTVVTLQHERDQLAALTRLAMFYYRQFESQVPSNSPIRSASLSGSTAYFLEYSRHVLLSLPHDWHNDTIEDIREATKVCKALPDLGVMHLVGQTMPRVFRGETTMLEEFRETGMLDDYYEHSFSSEPSRHWQTRMVEQIATRLPLLNILEIGAGTGGTTKLMLNTLGRRFQSYTFTDISAGFFGAAAAALSPFRDRLVFKTLDVERDPTSQGFQEGGYDVIIASFVLHATASLECTLANVRKLLRPGGQLIVGEGAAETAPISSFIFGPLPGWWLGRDEGRILSPHVSTPQWDRLLRKSGFSGIDTKAPDEWEQVLGVCLFSSQAVNGHVTFLRSPLFAPNFEHCPKIERLTIVGGKTTHIAQLVTEASALLKPYADEIRVFTSLADVDHDAPNAFMVSLADLDKPVFQNMTERDFVPFRRIFQEEKTLLWVTTGRRSEEPFSNMIVGFGRTAVHETPGLNLQHLDLANPHMHRVAHIIANNFLRLLAGATKKEEQQGVLWPIEPEIVVDSNGRHHVPRLLPLRNLNNRYNSGHRFITEDVDINHIPVVLRLQKQQQQKRHGATISLEMPTDINIDSWAEPASSASQLITLQIIHAVIPAVRTPLGHKFLALGIDMSSGATHLTLLSCLASIVTVPSATAPEFSPIPETGATTLSSMAAHLIALSILDPALPKQVVVVHNATDDVAEAIYYQAAAIGVEAVFITDRDSPSSVPKVCTVFLSRYTSQTEIWRRLPAKNKISCFVTLISENTYSETRDIILACLPASCRLETSNTLFSLVGSECGPAEEPSLVQHLQKALQYTQLYSNEFSNKASFVELEQLVFQGLHAAVPDVNGAAGRNDENGWERLTVVNLSSSTRLPARIRRLDMGRSVFKPNKTYWVLGLSGDLGISLRDWMIHAGATHIVITSRKPNIEQAWMNSHRQCGIDITILPCDITDWRALTVAHTSIKRTLPPIAGVFNGAMVLRDTSIRNMTFQQLDDVLRPKVRGSFNLDKLFSLDEPLLSFFILFSSINYIIGNPGQANYAAANAFQCALVAARRKQGLAGTAVNIGAIVGAGYIQRSTNYKHTLDLSMTRGNMMHLSEEDYHQIIGEAIAAGQPWRNKAPELTTGLLYAEHNMTLPPIWFDDPKFAHMIVQKKMYHVLETGHDAGMRSNAPAVVKERLKASRTAANSEKVIREAFAALLRQELQITDKEDAELMKMRSNEIGLDSLVSVDIRSWFLKATGVNIPVMRILSHNNMESLVQLAARSFSAEIKPQAANFAAGKPVTTSSVNFDGRSDTETYQTTTPGFISPPSCQPSPQYDGSGLEVDWEAETRPPTFDTELAHLLKSSSGYIPSPSAPPQAIVLTGITGLVGSHLLKHILQILPRNGRAICIGMRRLATHADPRVIFQTGDFTLPRLGLSPFDCASIFAVADAVVHVGADTSHLKPYMALRDANVGSTAELARMCLPRRIPLHYVSTVGVGLFSKNTELRPERVNGLPPGLDGEGYTISKLVCERMLERISEQTGLPVWIHRPSAILRLNEDSKGERASMDWLNGLLKYVRMLQAVPEIKYNKGALDMVHVKSVCDKIVRCLHSNGTNDMARTNRGVSYVHEVGDIVIPLDRMFEILDLDMGTDSNMHISVSYPVEEQVETGRAHNNMIDDSTRIKCEVLSMSEWTARAVARGLHPSVAELIKDMDNPDKLHYPALLKS
ncbi:hypothetical protein QQS21_004236 [Conoideocrella luteorostrata]|uniref:Polyketide synthase n=1 Tax=Conoideocrella luteorostrata TaxID=1105319 RepID=A0AAJ0CU72_9HYPO|nr:hypothetical protein QQS21_004236 [Conoideocrella luteorostrata]